MKYFYRDHLHLIEEGYEKLAKTISVSLLNAHPYTHDNAKQSNYPPLKHSTICEAPSKPPILEPHLSEGDQKENIPNRRNIFIVISIKCSILEVVAESFAAQNVLTVNVVRTPQHCSARLSKQHELKSASYVNTSPPEEKTEIFMNVERGGVENKTSNSCGLTVKISRFKEHDFCGNFFSFLHFLTYIIELPKRLGSSPSKTRNIVRIFLDSVFC